MCIVKLSDSSSGLERELQAAVAGGAGGSGSSGSGQRVSAFDGSGSAVEVVSPHDVLQPGWVAADRYCIHRGGTSSSINRHQTSQPHQVTQPHPSLLITCSHYETWLITEYCDRASLHDLLRGVGGARWAPDPGQRDLWTLLALLDIAQGLDYLHSNTIVSGWGGVAVKCGRGRGRKGEAGAGASRPLATHPAVPPASTVRASDSWRLKASECVAKISPERPPRLHLQARVRTCLHQYNSNL